MGFNVDHDIFVKNKIIQMTVSLILIIILSFREFQAYDFLTNDNLNIKQFTFESDYGKDYRHDSFQSTLPNEAFTQQIRGKNRNSVNQADAATFEIKATLSKCLKAKQCDCGDSFDCSLNDSSRTKECVKEDDENIRDCLKKVSLTLKIKNKGIPSCKTQFIILDHVLDEQTNKKHKILNPYVLKVIQKPVFQVYDLIYENVVNSGPSEKVINKNNDGFLGCSTENSNPTCGSMEFDNKEVPFSRGFCCSCGMSGNEKIGTNSDNFDSVDIQRTDSVKQFNDNLQTDIFNLGMPNINVPTIGSDGILKGPKLPYLPDDNKNNYGHDGFSYKRDIFKGNRKSISTQDVIPDKDNKNQRKRKKRYIHKRGGQDCEDRYVPPNADPSTYHDSAHCMEFSDVWYSVYKIAQPTIEHSLEIEIFERATFIDGQATWKRLTYTGPIFIGTSNPHYVSEDGNILAYYTGNNGQENEFSLDATKLKLLIPEVGRKDIDKRQYPEIRGGPEEYLVVKDSDIDLTGKSCNKAGVGYEAFVRQPERCDHEKNSCLQNQPKHLWQHDHELEENGKKGCYFLKNYGYMPEDPIRTKQCNRSSKMRTQNKLLYMYYLPCITSTINIHFAADTNVALKKDVLASITEVSTESLNPKKVTITAKVLNSGLVTSIFYVGIGACPMEIPASFGSINSQPVMIAPQHQHIFTLEIYCELTIRNFYCSLEVMNMKEQLIAIRRIRFEQFDRCICVWYCQCACFETDYGMKCRPLEIEQFRATGYKGGMPIATQVVNYSPFDDTLSVFLHIILYFCLTLWYMGIIKAFLGCCLIPIGLWGLDKILDLPKKMNRYYEAELREQKVVYDEDGWPIHPETGKKVNNIAPASQFVINMVFFLIFPFALIWNLMKKLLAPKYSTEEMFSDLDICKCKASQISLIKSSSLQNSLMKKSSIKQQTEDPSNENKELNETLIGEDSGAHNKDIKEDNEKKKKGCFPRR